MLASLKIENVEKIFFAEKFRPFFGNSKAVCLDGILHRYTLLVVLSHCLRKEQKEIQPC